MISDFLQMQLNDRQGSHARATTLAQSIPLQFSNGHSNGNHKNSKGHSKKSGVHHSLNQIQPSGSLNGSLQRQNPSIGSEIQSISFQGLANTNKRSTPLSVSEPSDSPLKRRIMRTSGSDSNLHSFLETTLPKASLVRL